MVVLCMLPYLYMNTPTETAPEEDQGFFFVAATAPQYATINYIEAYTSEFNKIYQSFPETKYYFTINSPTQPLSGMVLKPWEERSATQFSLKKILQNKLDAVAGLLSFAIIPSALPGGGSGTPIQFVIKTTDNFKELYNSYLFRELC